MIPNGKINIQSASWVGHWAAYMAGQYLELEMKIGLYDLSLNVSKRKELPIDFRKRDGVHILVIINDDDQQWDGQQLQVHRRNHH